MMTRKLLASILLCVGCHRVASLPEFPDIRLDSFHGAVREEIRKAHEAAKAAPQDAAASGRLGMVLHAHEQWNAAAASYERARALDPNRFVWPYYLSDVYAQMARREQALEALEQALHVNPDYAPAWLRKAELLLDMGKVRESRKLFQRIVAGPAQPVAGWYGLGRTQAALGDPASAIVSLETACRLYPDYGAAHFALVPLLRKAGQNDEASRRLRAYEQHKLDAPPAEDPRMAEVRALNVGAANFIRIGMQLEAEGKLAEAIQAHLQAAASDPGNEQAHINLIQLYARAGDARSAFEHYRRAIALNPNLAEAHYNYGVLLFGQEKYSEAKQSFERTLEINPQHAQAHNNLGYVLEMEGKTADAQRHYEKAVALDPNYRLARFHLGRVLVNQRRYADGIAHLEQTLEPDEESTPARLYALGAAHARAGDYVQAARRFQQARRKAEARGQSALAASIDRDMQRLEKVRLK